MDEITTISEIWEILVEYVPDKDKQAAADHLMTTLINLNLSRPDFEKIIGSDQYLQEAAAEYIDDDLDIEIDEW